RGQVHRRFPGPPLRQPVLPAVLALHVRELVIGHDVDLEVVITAPGGRVLLELPAQPVHRFRIEGVPGLADDPGPSARHRHLVDRTQLIEEEGADEFDGAVHSRPTIHPELGTALDSSIPWSNLGTMALESTARPLPRVHADLRICRSGCVPWPR